MVWTGDAIGRVTLRSPQERVAAAYEAIAAIFREFPYTAASAQPMGTP